MGPPVVFELVLKDADLIAQPLVLSRCLGNLAALVVPLLDEVLNVDVEVLVLAFQFRIELQDVNFVEFFGFHLDHLPVEFVIVTLELVQLLLGLLLSEVE